MNNEIDITEYLPHRAPFLMVDKVLSIDPHSVKTSFFIHPDNLFNDKGYLSETGLIENAAQNCSAIMGQTYFIGQMKDIKLIGFISSIKKIKIYALPPVESEIITVSKLLSKFNSGEYVICTTETSTFDCQNNMIFNSEINLFIQEQK